MNMNGYIKLHWFVISCLNRPLSTINEALTQKLRNHSDPPILKSLRYNVGTQQGDHDYARTLFDSLPRRYINILNVPVNEGSSDAPIHSQTSFCSETC